MQLFCHATDYKQQLLQLIAQAKKRILITALYLQADEAGEQILRALFVAKQQNPLLDVRIYVDFHRARRGLIGQSGRSHQCRFLPGCGGRLPAADSKFMVYR